MDLNPIQMVLIWGIITKKSAEGDIKLRYAYHVAYYFDGALASATFWIEAEEVKSTGEVMEFQKQIRLSNGLRHDSPVAVLSWARLPGDDQESRPTETNVRSFKPRS